MSQKLHQVDVFLGSKIQDFNNNVLPNILQKIQDCALGSSYRHLCESYEGYLAELEKTVGYYKSQVEIKEGIISKWEKESEKWADLVESCRNNAASWEASSERWKELYYQLKSDTDKKSVSKQPTKRS